MQNHFSSQLSRYQVELMRFQSVFVQVQESLKKRGRKPLNVAEFAILHVRGGRRVPLWIRSVDWTEAQERFQLDELSGEQLRQNYDHIEAQIAYFSIVPKTKTAILAAFLAGQVTATGQTLADFAGISLSTAHNWLRKCVEIKILEVFQSRHEVFYLNLDLIELCLVGRKTKQGAFRIGFLSDLNALRARRDWLAESSIANFYGSQSGPRLH